MTVMGISIFPIMVPLLQVSFGTDLIGVELIKDTLHLLLEINIQTKDF